MDLLEIPDLILLEMFSFLKIQERFHTLRQVCRRWKQLVEYQLETQTRAIVYDQERPFHRRWPSENRKLSSLEIVNQPFFNFCLANGHFKRLKKLYLYLVSGPSFESVGLMAKLIKCMCHLEELSIDRSNLGLFTWEPNQNINLQGFTFKNLKTLSVKQRLNEKVSINAPRLERLTVWGLYQDYPDSVSDLMIVPSHPERLKYLECDFISGETQKFPNLVQLWAQHVRSDFSLSHYPKLRQLNLCLNESIPHRRQNFLLSIESLLQQRKQLKLDHLEITNFGVRNKELTHLIESEYPPHNDRFCFWGPHVQELLSNYSNFTADRLPWVATVHYPVHLQHHRHLASFCSRINVQILRVNKYDCKYELDPVLLIKFLIEIGGINHLGIGKCSFGQEFYEQLKTVPFVTYLELSELSLMPSNFNFICNVKFLTGMFLHQDRIPIVSIQENVKKINIQVLSIEEKDFFLNFTKDLIKVQLVGKEIIFESLDEAFAFLKEIEFCRQNFV